MRCVGLDTNILAYAAGVRRVPADDIKIEATRSMLSNLQTDVRLVVASQSWGELLALLSRAGVARAECREILEELRSGMITAPVTLDVFDAALELFGTHQFQIWDAIIVQACAAAGCGLLLSEDMQDGFKKGGLLIANPLNDHRHPAIDAILQVP